MRCCSKSTGPVDVWNCCKTLRSLQLYITVLNVVHRNLIFTWKLACLAMSITCGYAAIAHFNQHPVFGTMYYIVFFETSFVYTVIYEKAFKIPYLMATAKISLSLRAQGMQNEVPRKVLARQLKSMPLVGIKVGGFHLLERTSTPVFLHYILVNIVNMLVTFK